MDQPRFVRFAAVSAIGFALQLGTVSVLTSRFGAAAPAATALGVAAAVLHNFVWHLGWTWSDRRMADPVRALARFVAANGTVSLVGNVAIVAGVVSSFGLTALPANVVAVAVCALLNYWLTDRFVFAASRVSEQPAAFIPDVQMDRELRASRGVKYRPSTRSAEPDATFADRRLLRPRARHRLRHIRTSGLPLAGARPDAEDAGCRVR